MLSSADIALLKTETKKYIANFTTEVTDDQANGLDRTEDQRKINFVRLLLEILEGNTEIAEGSEIIQNGDFSNLGVNWNNEGTVVWLFDGSDASASSVTPTFPDAILTQNLSPLLLADRIYKLTFDILTSTNSNLNVSLESPSSFSENFTTVGTKTITIDLTGLTDKNKILFTHTELASGADLLEIDNVSIKEQIPINVNLTTDEQDLLWQRITCLSKISVKDL